MMIKEIVENIKGYYLDDEYRQNILFVLLNFLVSVISLIMTIVNIKTEEYLLMWVTACFSLLCIVNIVIIKIKKIKNTYAYSLLALEGMVLLTYFVVSGNPDGFSVQWTLLVPAFAMAVVGKKMGTRFGLLTFFMVIFFFWTPFGRELLQYDYNETFMLRFPFVFICVMLAAWYLETIRQGAYERLKKAEEKARNLYRHDSLTGIYTRHAFSETLYEIFKGTNNKTTTAMMIDIDDFKGVNDGFGHNAGDEVLKTVARIITDNTCDDCFYCRWGGEEFLVLMQCGHNPYEIAEQIRKIAENTSIFYKDKEIHITLSIGIATGIQ